MAVKTWTTATGDKISLDTMSDLHLLNSISFLENLLRRNVLNARKLSELKKEARRRKVILN